MKADDKALIYPENKTYGLQALNYFQFLQTSYIDSQPTFESRINWLEWVKLHGN
jgi:hypothetical protein